MNFAALSPWCVPSDTDVVGRAHSRVTGARCRSRDWACVAVLTVSWLCTLGPAAAVSMAQPASLSLVNRSYVRIPTSPDFVMQQFTLSLWLKPTGPGERGGGTLVSKSGRPEAGSYLCSWWLGWDSSSHKVIGMVVHEFAVSAAVITSNATVALGQEAHAAMTFDGTTLRLYINGVLDRQLPFGFVGVYYSTEDVLIGGFNPGNGYTYNRFDGTIDDVSIWNRALTAGEIASLATCEAADSGSGLVAHLPFTAQSLADRSGRGHGAVAEGAIGFGQQAAALGALPEILIQPSPQQVCTVNGSASFSVVAQGSGSLMYQWQLRLANGTWATLGNDPMPLACPGGGFGFAYASPLFSNPVNIAVRNCPGAGPWGIRCVVSNSCGSVTSEPTTLTVGGTCACSLADIAGGGPDGRSPDGVVDGADFIAFINSFSTGDPGLDPLADVAGGGAGGLSPDGIIDGSDFIAFINAFAAGC